MSRLLPSRHIPIALLILILPCLALASVEERELDLDALWDSGTGQGRTLAAIAADPDADRETVPTQSWWWLLDPGERIIEVELSEVTEEVLAHSSRRAMRAAPVDEEGRSSVLVDAGPLWGDDYEFRLSPPRLLHGRVLQSITLTPLRADADRLYGLKQATLRLRTTAADNPVGLKAERADFPLRHRILSSLGDRLLNPENLPPAMDRAVGGSGFPTDVPSIEGAAVDMVIVTVDSFADLAQSYADERTRYGTPTVVRSVDWIADHYPTGSDRAEMIRHFVQDAYAKWSVEYLLLLGDADFLPPRFAFSALFNIPRETPTDLYFGCVDGDWNADHDYFWGEAADTSEADIGDVADLLPEVLVGRLPARSREEVSIQLDKSLAYQQAESMPYQNRILMLAEVLFPVNYPANPNITLHGGDYCEHVYEDYLDENHEVVRLYESSELFTDPDILELTADAAYDSMNNGFGVVLHNGHGYRQTMSLGDASLDNGHIRQLGNAGNTFLLCMINCSAAAHDFDSLAEVFLSNGNGGAMGVIGSTRETYPNFIYSYTDVIFENLYLGDEMRLGEIFYSSLNAHEPYTIEDNVYRWTHLTMCLIGDPSLRIHYWAAGDLSTDLPATHPIDGGPLTVTLTDTGANPVQGASVAILRGDEDYQRAVTDGAGQASFALNPETAGEYELRAEARNLKPVTETFIANLPGAGPLLSVSTIIIDDLSDGTVQGNGNGIAERGETLRLILTVRNSGPSNANIVTGTLSSSHPEMVFLDDSDYYGSILAGGQSSGTSPYLVEIQGAEDDAILDFSLSLATTNGSFIDDFYLEAASPVLTLHRTLLDDDGGGNGDGILDVGETADLAVALSNYGRGTGQTVEASITAPPGSGLIVLQGSSSLGDLAPLSTNLGPADFSIRRIDANPPLLELVLTDAFARGDTMPLLLERPVEIPSAPEFSYLRGAAFIRMDWEPSADAAAYVVLRATDIAGPYVEVSDDWVISSSYEASDLQPWTYYWYKVQPLSSGGLLGSASEAGSVRSNPSFLSGWPVALGAASMSSPLVADVDGDGDNELFIGADKLYGFNADGKELSDGDDNPLTIGPISDLGNSFANAIAAGDLTDNPGLEIVASSWVALKVYVFEFNETANGLEASLAPGWPKSVAHTDGIWASPSLADIDGDEDLEVLITETGFYGTLLAWHHDGSEVIDGDDDPGTDGVFHTDMGVWPRSTAALVDIDGNRDKEIFVGTGEDHGYLKGLDGDGSELPGFPFHAGSGDIDEWGIFSSPAVGDIDHDEDIEIVFAAENDSLYVLGHDGQIHPGWPVHWRNDSWAWCASPLLADVTGDGRLEIFTVGVHTREYMELAWLDADGNFLPGWPVSSPTSTQSSPIVGDIDGDGLLETVLGNEFAELLAWNHDGTPLAGFPIIVGDFIRGTPSLTDLDMDGQLDLVMSSWDMNVYVWTFPTSFDPSSTPWYTFMHDQKRTGRYGEGDGIVDVVDTPPAGALRLDPNWPNPFNPVTHIRLVVGEGGPRPVNLSIHDAQGRLVTTLVNQKLTPGEYVRSWDGRDSYGRPQASGVYFAFARVGDERASQKLVLVK